MVVERNYSNRTRHSKLDTQSTTKKWLLNYKYELYYQPIQQFSQFVICFISGIFNC